MKTALKAILVLFVIWIAGHAIYRAIEPSAQSGVFKRLVTDVPWAGYAHIVAGSFALILGAFQISSRIRKNNIRLHRGIGNTYVACVLISTMGAMVSLPQSQAPFSAVLGFWMLAIVWPIVTLAGYPWRGKFDVNWHGKLMIYSYALTCAAISLRLILIPLLISGMPFRQAYPIAAWGGTIVNVIITFLTLKIVQSRVAAKTRAQQSHLIS